MAASRKATALSLRWSGMTCTKAIREPSSMQNMHVFPADALVTVDCARISAGDAMADRADPPELLDIEVDEFAWPVALVASNWFSRLQGTELVQPQPTQNAADGGRRDIC